MLILTITYIHTVKGVILYTYVVWRNYTTKLHIPLYAPERAHTWISIHTTRYTYVHMQCTGSSPAILRHSVLLPMPCEPCHALCQVPIPLPGGRVSQRKPTASGTTELSPC